MIMGEAIAAWRESHEVTIRQLAKRIGIDKSTLSRVEHGENCDCETVAKILAWLFIRKEQMEPTP